MNKLNSGDLVYLPANFMLRKYNIDGTVREYCEIKYPCICILLKHEKRSSDVFYRGETWSAPNDLLEPYTGRHQREAKNVSYVN